MATLIGPEQVGERPQTPEELADAIKLMMLNAVSLNLTLENNLLRLQREQLATQAECEADAWGLMMKRLRKIGALD